MVEHIIDDELVLAAGHYPSTIFCLEEEGCIAINRDGLFQLGHVGWRGKNSLLATQQ